MAEANGGRRALPRWRGGPVDDGNEQRWPRGRDGRSVGGFFPPLSRAASLAARVLMMVVALAVLGSRCLESAGDDNRWYDGQGRGRTNYHATVPAGCRIVVPVLLVDLAVTRAGMARSSCGENRMQRGPSRAGQFPKPKVVEAGGWTAMGGTWPDRRDLSIQRVGICSPHAHAREQKATRIAWDEG